MLILNEFFMGERKRKMTDEQQLESIVDTSLNDEKIDRKEWLPIVGVIQVLRNSKEGGYSLALCQDKLGLYVFGLGYHSLFSFMPIISSIMYGVNQL